MQIRGFAHTLTVTCPHCGSVLDTSTPEVEILQKFQGKSHIQPKIPLGSRGKFGDTMYEVIGFQVRQEAGDAASTGKNTCSSILIKASGTSPSITATGTLCAC